MLPASADPLLLEFESSVSSSRPCGHDHRRFRLRREVFAGIDEAVPLQLELLVVELAIPPAHREQLAMGAALDDFPALQHQDLIGAHDGGEPVRNDEGGAPRAQRAEAVLDQPLTLAVEAR